MQKSLFVTIALAAACGLAAASTYIAEAVVCSWRRVSRWGAAAFDFVIAKIKPANAKHLDAPKRALLGAVQMMGRMIRRDRPVVTPCWRMCPSI